LVVDTFSEEFVEIKVIFDEEADVTSFELESFVA
jgi:hypothetical protein